METAIFHNISSQPFTGYWDGKKRTFASGSKKLLPLYLAEHFALHLTNKILIEKGDYTSTSPKKPEDVPNFKELFDQICIPQDTDEDDIVEMPVSNIVDRPKVKTIVDNEPPHVIGSPVDDSDDEESFAGMSESLPEEV